MIFSAVPYLTEEGSLLFFDCEGEGLSELLLLLLRSLLLGLFSFFFLDDFERVFWESSRSLATKFWYVLRFSGSSSRISIRSIIKVIGSVFNLVKGT